MEQVKADVETVARTCSAHGEYRATQIKVLDRLLASPCPACNAAIAEDARREEREQQDRRRANTLLAAQIPARFRGLHFSDFRVASPDQRVALAIAQRYAETFADRLARGDSMLFVGAVGTGKTHLAATVLQAVIRNDYVGRYVTLHDMIGEVRAAWKSRDLTEDQVLGRFAHYDLLALDEFGNDVLSDVEARITFDLIDRRYANRRPTMAITNQNIERLLSIVGDRIVDRLCESRTTVAFSWASWRQRVTEEAP